MNPFHVFDTYARTAAGRILHFDVVLKDKDPPQALAAARAWLASIGEPNAEVNAENCVFCHSLTSVPEDMRDALETQGYAIYKLEGCPK